MRGAATRQDKEVTGKGDGSSAQGCLTLYRTLQLHEGISMKTTRYLEKILVVLLVTLLGSAGGVPAVAADREEALRITVLSNRADLISDGDALVEVVLPPDVAPSKVRVTVNGHDVSGAFAVRADGRFYGLIDGLALGRNEVVAVVLPSKSKH